MVLEKRALRAEDLDAQAALELPDREMLLVTVVITNVLNNNTVEIDVRNNRIAVQICAAVTLLSELVATPLDCDIQQ